MTILRTPRLTLRPCCPDDRADFIALEQDPAVMRYLNGGHPIDPGLPGPVDSEPVDPDATFLMPRGTEPHVWTARRTDGGGFVGWFCLWPDSETQAELGYRLRRADWGLGFATEGAAALVDWGFGSNGYDVILSTTMAVNQGSRRVMEKLGMRYARTDFTPFPEPIPGSEHGEVWYVLTRAQWSGKAASPAG